MQRTRVIIIYCSYFLWKVSALVNWKVKEFLFFVFLAPVDNNFKEYKEYEEKIRKVEEMGFSKVMFQLSDSN